jgi:hypothetical protein
MGILAAGLIRGLRRVPQQLIARFTSSAPARARREAAAPLGPNLSPRRLFPAIPQRLDAQFHLRPRRPLRDGRGWATQISLKEPHARHMDTNKPTETCYNLPSIRAVAQQTYFLAPTRYGEFSSRSSLLTTRSRFRTRYGTLVHFFRRGQPPLSRGMKSVSSAVGSKLLRTSLLPSPSRFAAVKPAPVSILSAPPPPPRPRRRPDRTGAWIAGVVHNDLRCHCVLLARWR